MVNSKFKFNLKLHFHKDLNFAYSTKHKHNLPFSQWINYVHQSLHKIFTDWWHQIHFNALYFWGGETPFTFSRILHFGTGSKEPPPLRFYPEPSICYWQEKLPKTITCTNTLLGFQKQHGICIFEQWGIFVVVNILFVKRAIYHEYSITLLALFNSPNLKGGVSIFITICPLSLLS